MRKISARARWTLFSIVCVLGYVLFGVLAVRLDPNAQPRWRIDRADALAAARGFAAEQGVDVSPATGWWGRWRHERVTGGTHGEGVGRYLRAHPGPAARLARRLVPDLHARGHVRSPAGDVLTVELDPEGRRVGFRRRFLEEPPSEDPEPAAGDALQDQAREVARAALTARVGEPGVIRFQLQDADQDRSLPGAPIHTFTWEGRFEELPELTLEAVLAVRDQELIREAYDLDVELPDVASRSVVAGFVFIALLLGALVFATLRLIQRAREGEVSRSRGFVLGGAFFVLAFLRVLFKDGPISQTGEVMDLLGPALGLVLGALALVFAWVALEGDVREALPRRLTTFDTLLSGRLWSRDVAVSTLVGVAMAGPALALLQAPRLLPGTGSGIADELAELFAARGAFVATYVQPVILWIGVLIFVPLALFLRRIRSTKRALILLAVVLPLLTVPMLMTDPYTDAAEIVRGAAAVAFMVLPFVFHDLLAALWTTLAVAAAPRILYLLLQPAPAVRADGVMMAVLAGLGLAVVLAAMKWGRSYRAEEVRPIYARNLAERLELQAERRLADAALERLLPSRLPEIPGVTLAASRQRATAGGATTGGAKAGGSQFYDLLALPEERLGVAMVGLDDQGAAAALRLALLKGLLRTYGPRRRSPRAVFDGMQSRLPASEEPATTPFAGVYAIYDAARRTVRYTRRGAASELFLRRRGGSVEVLEGTVDGEARLAPGEALILVHGAMEVVVATEAAS